VYHVKVFD
jgi:hypothetical protein